MENLSTAGKSERRAFTMDELKNLLAVAGQDWKTAILVALYTGLRLSDVVSLTWANPGLERDELTIRTQKTGRIQIAPIAKPLRRHLETLPAGDDPKAPLCPGFHDEPGTALSKQGALAKFSLSRVCDAPPGERERLTAWSAGWTTKLVAQSCTLPYRRIVFCGASPSPSTLGLAGALPIGNRRYSRLKICATVLRSICRQSHGLHGMDLAQLHARVSTLPDGKSGVLLRLRGLAGQPAFSRFMRVIA
ncbi:MAG: hypothetical protein FJ398_07935 [Verrucomicrobia bacterium]|nr:hypothetical protein [Verrucomicrobiota bacterium]